MPGLAAGHSIAKKPTSDRPAAVTRSFIDTNLLVYADAGDDPVRQGVALALLRQLHGSASGVLSTQVLQEYCNVAIRKLKLSPAHIRANLDLYEQFEVVQITPVIIRAGLDLHQTRNLGFYDAIICASAQISGCDVLYTEDMNSGQSVANVLIVNPFHKST